MTTDNTTYINTFTNNPSAENLMKIVIADLNCEFALIAWNINNSWFISAIYDKYIDDQLNTNQNAGWYLLDEPTEKNIPIRHTKLRNINEIRTPTSKILVNKDVDFSSDKKFIVTAFLEKITLLDLLNRQKTRQELMISNISHSIRTPLNGILHMTKIITDTKNTLKEEVVEAAYYLNQSSITLATNIFDIIDLSKLEAGKLTLNNELFNLHELINNLIVFVNTRNKNASITIDHHIESSVPEYVFSDPKRIKQILINLMENALSHTQKGEICLYVTALVVNMAEEEDISTKNMYQHHINFIVRDSGEGIDQKSQLSLFKPMEMSTNSKQHCLNLRISYLLSKLLNGNLKLLESNKHGSCFEFSIIVSDEEDLHFNASTLKSLRNKSVLLLGDIGDLILVFKKYSMKYTIALNYEEVLLLHKDKQFDLIVGINCKDLKYIYFATPVLEISVHLSPTEFKLKLIDIFNTPTYDMSNIRLLIVEDEQINRIVIEKVLRQAGFIAITMVNDGPSALATYKRNPNKFDVLLIDIRMPHMSGFELADLLHAINPNIKMIGVTAQTISEESLKPWFKEFVYKPLKSTELQKKICEVYDSGAVSIVAKRSKAHDVS
jgi:hypothetical protein